MNSHIPTGRGPLLAYAISALATFFWVACVLPAGETAAGIHADEVTPTGREGQLPAQPSDGVQDRDAEVTPMRRERWLLVPALLLLIAGPVGIILSRTRRGLASVLAATDAFVAIYMATVLTGWGAMSGTVSGVLVGLLYGLGAVSLLEVIRLLRRGDDAVVPAPFRGVRLALCLLALLTPSWFLVKGGCELASLLVPYGLIAVGTGGAVVARTADGLRLTAAILHLAFAAHVFIVLRYTLFEGGGPRRPVFVEVGTIGWTALGLSVAILFLALVQVVRLARHVRAGVLADAAAAGGPA